MSNKDYRIVDPVLSEVAHGYRNNEFVAEELFPRIAVAKRGGKVIKFGKEAFKKQGARRAPGSQVERVSYGYTAEPIALVQDALEGVLPWEHLEESTNIPGIDLASMTINSTMNSLLLAHECEVAELAQDATQYEADNKLAVTGDDKWNTNAGISPAKQVDELQKAMRSKCGVEANTMLLPYSVFKDLRHLDDVKKKFYSQKTGQVNIGIEQLASYFNVDKIVVGKAIVEGSSGRLEDVWTSVVLGYVPPVALRNVGVPSYGYTYVLKGYPVVEQAYNEKNAKSWIYPVTYERRAYLTGMNAGALITGAI